MEIGVAGMALAAVAVTALLIVFSSIKTVPQSEQWTVERFGRYVRTLTPGISVLTPFVEKVGRRLSMRETLLDIPSQEVITKDNAIVKVDGVMFYQVLDAAKAAYEVSGLEIALINLALTNIRSVIGAIDLDDTLSQRDRINVQLLGVIDHATAPWGVKVGRIELRDIVPPESMLAAMGKQMTAERTKRADILSAEGAKQAAILRAEGEKQAAVLQAEGKRQAAFLEAEARERMAQAEAAATRMVSEAITKGDPAAINYFVAQKYIEAFGRFADSKNQKLLILPSDTANIAARLASMLEPMMAAVSKPPTGGGDA